MKSKEDDKIKSKNCRGGERKGEVVVGASESCERSERERASEGERSIISSSNVVMTRGLWVEFTWLGFFLEEEGWMESERDVCEFIYLF